MCDPATATPDTASWLSRQADSAASCLASDVIALLLKWSITYQGPAQYAEAAKVLRQKHPEDAIVALGRAADMSVKCPGACNLQRAARLRRDQADLYEADRNSTAAIDALEQAVELFDADGAANSATACRLRIADMLALQGDLFKARQLFEQLVAEAFNSPSKAAGGMPCYMLRFRAGLCYLADGRSAQKPHERSRVPPKRE